MPSVLGACPVGWGRRFAGICSGFASIAAANGLPRLLDATDDPVPTRRVDRIVAHGALVQREEQVLDAGLEDASPNLAGVRDRAAIALGHCGREVGAG